MSQMKTNHPTLNKILTDMYASGKIDLDSLNRKQAKAVIDMMSCHTEVSGFTKEVCKHCGKEIIHYGSCNNSACGQCGKKRRDEWIENEKTKKINVPYFHIVFTVPDKHLNALFMHDPKFMYNALLKAAANVLRKFSADPKFLGIKKGGFSSMLHTFGSAMTLHCHVHVIFPAIGFNKDNELVIGKENFLFPAKAVAQAFKGELLEMVKEEYSYPDTCWRGNINQAAKKDKLWNVQIQACEGNPDHVIKYLSRYVNRTAISNGRLVSHKNGKVRFKYKNYRNNSKISEMELKEEDFLRRILLHILPDHFMKYRRYGFLSGNQAETLKKIQNLTNTDLSCSQDTEQDEDHDHEDDLDWWDEDITDLEYLSLKRNSKKNVCPSCGNKTLVVMDGANRATTYAEKKFRIQEMIEKSKPLMLSG